MEKDELWESIARLKEEYVTILDNNRIWYTCLYKCLTAKKS